MRRAETSQEDTGISGRARCHARGPHDTPPRTRCRISAPDRASMQATRSPLSPRAAIRPGRPIGVHGRPVAPTRSAFCGAPRERGRVLTAPARAGVVRTGDERAVGLRQSVRWARQKFDSCERRAGGGGGSICVQRSRGVPNRQTDEPGPKSPPRRSAEEGLQNGRPARGGRSAVDESLCTQSRLSSAKGGREEGLREGGRRSALGSGATSVSVAAERFESAGCTGSRCSRRPTSISHPASWRAGR